MDVGLPSNIGDPTPKPHNDSLFQFELEKLMERHNVQEYVCSVYGRFPDGNMGSFSYSTGSLRTLCFLMKTLDRFVFRSI